MRFVARWRDIALALALVASSAPRAWAQDRAPAGQNDSNAIADSAATDSLAAGQDSTAAADSTLVPPGFPVVLRGDTLLTVRARVGAFAPEERAEAIRDRILAISRDPEADTDSVYLQVDGARIDLFVDGRIVLTVTDEDAAAERMDRAALAEAWREAVQGGLERQSFLWLVRSIALGVFGVFLLGLVIYWVFRVVNTWLFPRGQEWIEANRGGRIPAVRLQKLEFLSAERTADLLAGAMEVARIVVLGLLVVVAVPAALGLFPWTQGIASRLVGYVMDPATTGWRALLDYLPNLFTIAVIVVATHFALKLIALVFRGVASGTLRIDGFHRDWAMPTYRIVRFLVIVLAAILIWPYLPSSDSPAFRGIAAFLGLLLSFGSAGAVANVVGGMVIIYMRPFQEGDRVKIADTVGDVVGRTLLVTRVRTIKNVDITIPNAMILSSHIVNFSSSARKHGLILHDSVTIGYDAPWRQVHELLIEAARRTESCELEPPPFVLQTALDDFYVRYEINVYTRAPNRMAGTYSELRTHIQDLFNEAGLEIMSPHYAAARDGSRIAIPEDYLPPAYEAPPFRFAGLYKKVGGQGEAGGDAGAGSSPIPTDRGAVLSAEVEAEAADPGPDLFSQEADGA
ncbi:MAG TPA: mechanosensitive ion channel family protein [Longimicrobiales bacterium]|nr:mechanosensitive ion channel family protein [Longimicrobiales bacterium]